MTIYNFTYTTINFAKCKISFLPACSAQTDTEVRRGPKTLGWVRRPRRIATSGRRRAWSTWPRWRWPWWWYGGLTSTIPEKCVSLLWTRKCYIWTTVLDHVLLFSDQAATFGQNTDSRNLGLAVHQHTELFLDPFLCLFAFQNKQTNTLRSCLLVSTLPCTVL